MYHIGMKQMQARLQKELIHTLYAILFVRVNSNFIDFLGKFFFPKFPNNFITIFFLKWSAEMDGKFKRWLFATVINDGRS